ncbi:hypothetical protein ACEPTV_33740, partial [Burkholderia pseudomallei]|uniref:hypothetical protein n=1 Tax=Burkholderia pseudomallei TaxID=28450 RepID=UPI00358F9056
LAEHLDRRGAGNGALTLAGLEGEEAAVRRNEGLERPAGAAGNLGFVYAIEKVHVVSCVVDWMAGLAAARAMRELTVRSWRTAISSHAASARSRCSRTLSSVAASASARHFAA